MVEKIFEKYAFSLEWKSMTDDDSGDDEGNEGEEY